MDIKVEMVIQCQVGFEFLQFTAFKLCFNNKIALSICICVCNLYVHGKLHIHQ